MLTRSTPHLPLPALAHLEHTPAAAGAAVVVQAEPALGAGAGRRAGARLAGGGALGAGPAPQQHLQHNLHRQACKGRMCGDDGDDAGPTRGGRTEQARGAARGSTGNPSSGSAKPRPSAARGDHTSTRLPQPAASVTDSPSSSARPPTHPPSRTCCSLASISAWVGGGTGGGGGWLPGSLKGPSGGGAGGPSPSAPFSSLDGSGAAAGGGPGPITARLAALVGSGTAASGARSGWPMSTAAAKGAGAGASASASASARASNPRWVCASRRAARRPGGGMAGERD